MLTSDFDYHLPPERIAQQPAPERSASRMMVLRRGSGEIEHRRVVDLPGCLEAGDLLVVNDTRVIPARVYGFKSGTGGKVEVLFLERAADGVWDALLHASRPAAPGTRLVLAGGAIRAEVVGRGERGTLRLAVTCEGDLEDALARHGAMPLPPYIKRPADAADAERYQTIYAREPGAVAAPTAGLHFTPELFAELDRRGVSRAGITLHVGWGTFRPVKAPRVEDHVMDGERFEIGEAAAHALARARQAGRRVVAVGSTTVRALETAALDPRGPVAQRGRSALFIHPPYDFQIVGAMLTNFHLPQSTLLMMVCAFAGRETVLRAYADAVRRQYRFFSYGDCMLIL